MRSKSLYITNEKKNGSLKPKKTSLIKSIVTLIFALFAVLPILATGFSQIVPNDNNNAQLQTENAEAFDIVRNVMCEPIAPISWVGPFRSLEEISGSPVPNPFGDRPSAMIYQAVNTDIVYYYLFSKSAIVGAPDEVDTGLNSILNFATLTPSFGSVNDWVFQTELDETREEGTEEFEPGEVTKISPYDRFGVAGLQWTSYGGEWKYYQVDACADEPEAEDNELGIYYDDRVEPKTVWEDRAISEDPRTQQHNLGPVTRYSYAFSNIVSNMIFEAAKFAVVVVISVASIAFSDVVSLLGIDTLLVGNDPDSPGGIFETLYTGIFMPLIVIVMAFTGFYMLWYGIAKRQYRQALVQGGFKSLLCFFAAIAIFINPGIFIALPNTIAVIGQSLIFSAANTGGIGGYGLCESEIGGFGTEDITPDSNGNYQNMNANANILERASSNASAAIGCSFWQAFLFTPWSQGQFGETWHHTFAEEDADGNSYELPGLADSGTLGNDPENADYVGTGMVPLGPDAESSSIHNWAVFQLSTQTDRHYDIASEGSLWNNYSNAGVHNDWWRIVDATSNYYEEQVNVSDYLSMEITGGSQALDALESETSLIPARDMETTEFWDEWAGNSGGNIGLALQTVIIAIVGTLGVFIFSALAVMYSIGLAILMAFAPIMLLFGCWAGRGQEIFKSWLELVINTTIKRIIIGLMFVFMLALTMSGLAVLEDVGFFHGIIIIALGSYLIIKNRHKLLDMFASVQLGSAVNFGRGAQKLGGTVSGISKGTSKIATGAAVGTVAGIRHGGGLLKLDEQRNQERQGLKKYTHAFKDIRLNTSAVKGIGTGLRTGAGNSFRNQVYAAASSSQFARHSMAEYEQGAGDPTIGGKTDMNYCVFCGQPLNIKDAGTQLMRDMETSNYYHLQCGEDIERTSGKDLQIVDNPFLKDTTPEFSVNGVIVTGKNLPQGSYTASIAKEKTFSIGRDGGSASFNAMKLVGEGEHGQVFVEISGPDGFATSINVEIPEENAPDSSEDPNTRTPASVKASREATGRHRRSTKSAADGFGGKTDSTVNRARARLDPREEDQALEEKKKEIARKRDEEGLARLSSRDLNKKAQAEVDEEGKFGVSSQNIAALAVTSMEAYYDDLAKHSKELAASGHSREDAIQVEIPELPKEIKPYVNQEAMANYLQNGDYQLAFGEFADGWRSWAEKEYGYGKETSGYAFIDEEIRSAEVGYEERGDGQVIEGVMQQHLAKLSQSTLAFKTRLEKDGSIDWDKAEEEIEEGIRERGGVDEAIRIERIKKRREKMKQKQGSQENKNRKKSQKAKNKTQKKDGNK